MKQVKVFIGRTPYVLEEVMNQWLKNIETSIKINIIDVKYVIEDTSLGYNSMIMYEVEDN